jgi:hypothetical protein
LSQKIHPVDSTKIKLSQKDHPVDLQSDLKIYNIVVLLFRIIMKAIISYHNHIVSYDVVKRIYIYFVYTTFSLYKIDSSVLLKHSIQHMLFPLYGHGILWCNTTSIYYFPMWLGPIFILKRGWGLSIIKR